MASSFVLKIESQDQVDVLIDALSSVVDIESDQCVDLVRNGLLRNATGGTGGLTLDINDDGLSDLITTRSRVIAAKETIAKLKVLDLGGDPYKITFTAPVVEILERGLQFLTDMLHDQVLEPFYKVNYDPISKDYLIQIRKAVEVNLNKFVVAKDLHNTIRRYA